MIVNRVPMTGRGVIFLFITFMISMMKRIRPKILRAMEISQPMRGMKARNMPINMATKP